jgi:hypothetical protein
MSFRMEDGKRSFGIHLIQGITIREESLYQLLIVVRLRGNGRRNAAQRGRGQRSQDVNDFPALVNFKETKDVIAEPMLSSIAHMGIAELGGKGVYQHEIPFLANRLILAYRALYKCAVLYLL